jgi:sua5/yciO/yrdC/ywlC family protein
MTAEKSAVILFLENFMQILSFQDNKARQIVEDGYVLALPTETVYGVGVRFDDQNAYNRLVKVKRRSPDKPIAVMCAKNLDLSTYFVLNEGTKRVMEHLLPGPLTILVRTKENAPYQTHLGTKVAGIRIPDKEDLLAFLSSLPFPLQVTSANISGQPPLTAFEEVYECFHEDKEVRGIVKGTCDSGTPTTVVDLTGEAPIVLRQGEITKEEIEKYFYMK